MMENGAPVYLKGDVWPISPIAPLSLIKMLGFLYLFT